MPKSTRMFELDDEQAEEGYDSEPSSNSVLTEEEDQDEEEGNADMEEEQFSFFKPLDVPK